MSKFWAERIEPRVLALEQNLTKNEDGSVIFKCTVNSINEIASWIVNRGEGVKVLEPKELRDAVINLANGALRNYSNNTVISNSNYYVKL